MRLLVCFVFALSFLMPQNSEADGEVDAEQAAFLQQSRAMVKTFASGLKGALQAAIEEGGPIHAIPVCHEQAPEISRELSTPSEWTIGRTSHRLRNPDNAPDDWESAGLEEFLARAAGGESLDKMERVALVERDGVRAYRYMRAIPVSEVCLTCHGADIEPELKAKIEAFYPEDRATDFALDELRGAFTVTETLAD